MLDGTWDLLFLMWRWWRWGRFHQYGEHHKHLNQSGYVWTNLWTSLGFKHVSYVWESVKGHSWCVWSFGGKSLEGSDQEKRESFCLSSNEVRLSLQCESYRQKLSEYDPRSWWDAGSSNFTALNTWCQSLRWSGRARALTALHFCNSALPWCSLSTAVAHRQ